MHGSIQKRGDIGQSSFETVQKGHLSFIDILILDSFEFVYDI